MSRGFCSSIFESEVLFNFLYISKTNKHGLQIRATGLLAKYYNWFPIIWEFIIIPNCMKSTFCTNSRL